MAQEMHNRSTVSSPLVVIKDVSVGYGDGPLILKDASLEIGRGEFLTLLGPSGCGKSTILNIIAGLLKPRAGEVTFEGRDIVGVNTDVGYMTQEDTLLPWRTVFSNIAMPLRIRRTPREKIQADVQKYLALLDLEHAAEMYPIELSGGMRRRALLARSMIYDPAILLMDEPFAALDAQMRQRMHIELRAAVRSINQTVLFVTHDIAEAALLSDRVLIVGGGPPGSIIKEYRLPFAADRDIEELPFTSEFSEVEKELHRGLLQARATGVAERRAA